MQTPDKGKDYKNNNPWTTVKRSRKKHRNKPKPKPKPKPNTDSREHKRKQPSVLSSRGEYSKTYNTHAKAASRRPDRFSQVRDEQYKPSPKLFYTPPVPVGPNYASITKQVKEDEHDVEKNVDISPDKYGSRIIIHPIPHPNKGKKTVRNQVQNPNNNVSFDTWEHIYFKHILDLNDIFSEGIEKIGINTGSLNFLEVFSHFIRDCSSGEISPYIEDLDPEISEFYNEYTIKRNGL